LRLRKYDASPQLIIIAHVVRLSGPQLFCLPDMRTIKVSVFIVGAGPVGLATALDLGWRGIDCLVIDQEPEQEAAINVHPRAAAVTPRTMEFCRRWGVAEAVRAAGFPRDYPPNVVYCTGLQGHLVFRQQFASMRDRAPLSQSPETRERCPQIWFDPILARELQRYPSGNLRRPWRLESFEDTGDAVIGRVCDLTSGEILQVVADYMVACDGPTSPIRQTLGIAATGKGILSYSINAILEIPDFLRWHDKGPAERYLFLDRRGTWSNLTVIDGRTRFRFTLTGNDAMLDRDSLDLHAAIRTTLGERVPYDLIAIAPWRRREAIADQFRVGRILLAGDAAHTIPPNLGMGMNTGVGDAVDLGWKLEALLRGWGGPALLDSYQAERRPVAVCTAEASTQAYKLWMTASADHGLLADDGEAGVQARERVAEFLRSALPDGWDTLGLQLGYCYEDSPIIIPDGRPKPCDQGGLGHYVQTARPGARAPHFWLADGRSSLDLFGRGFTLLKFDDTASVKPLMDDAASCGVPVSVVNIADAAAAALYDAPLVLVRPDGHVAWRGEGASPVGANVMSCVSGHGQSSGVDKKTPAQDLVRRAVSTAHP